MRGAECHTDHQLLCMRVRVTGKGYHHKQAVRPKRFNVAKLTNSEDYVAFQEEIVSKTQAKWPHGGSAEEKWLAMRSALTEAAETVLGTESRRQPDWFRESKNLQPALQRRNQLYNQWLTSKSADDLQRFRKARSETRRVIRAAKNAWFQAKAEEAQRGRFGGKTVWQCIRAMQSGRRGLVPSTTGCVRDEDGNKCTLLSEQHQRWRRHFTKVLNVRSQFEVAELEMTRQRPIRAEMAAKPTIEELAATLAKLKNGKAGGSSRILPEMVKAGCCTKEFLTLLLDLVHTAWEEQRVPRDWSDAILIPIPKKGDLSICDNWRGISLLEVVGKVVARILQERLQQVAEVELPESQCGFRKGRGCSDMIFTLRQLVEKSVEHRSRQFITFVDLKKAYDSVPRTALWRALEKLGVPDSVVNLVKSFHDGMKAQLSINGELVEEKIDVDNGLRQGCTMAPTLFNLYACLMMERWTARVEDLEGAGTCLLYKYDGKLFRRSTRDAHQTRMSDCQFADDTALLATTRYGAEQATLAYVDVAQAFGLTVSLEKTKLMVTGFDIEDADREPITVGESEIGCVDKFPYLGSLVSSSGRVDAEVDHRIASASRAFGALRRAVFTDRTLTTTTKRKVYQACVMPVLLYGCECWTLMRKNLNRLNAFHHRCIRTMLGTTRNQQWEQHITSTRMRDLWGDQETLDTKIAKRRLEWLGHVARMPDHRMPKMALFGWLQKTRPPGGPRKRWRDVIRKDLQAIGVPEKQWYEATVSREGWNTKYQRLQNDLGRQEQAEPSQQPHQVLCLTCNRCFRRESDKKRHKCLAERIKPIQEQRGALQCTVCQRWFRSKGGLAVHRCSN